MITWKDKTCWRREEKDRSIPRIMTAEIGEFRLSVHRHIGLPGVWKVSCKPDVIPCVELKSADLEDAKCEAVAMLESICERALNEIRAKG
jgi:hypothetical protein